MTGVAHSPSTNAAMLVDANRYEVRVKQLEKSFGSKEFGKSAWTSLQPVGRWQAIDADTGAKAPTRKV
jgi:hypothetical protein